MKKIFFISLLLSLAVTSFSQTGLDERAEEIVSQMTLQEKLDYIGGYKGFYIRGVERLGLPEIKMSDGPLGVRNYGPTTAYPASIAIAASWNRDVARQFGEAIGSDARARGVHILLAPGVNIYRSPLCGRNFEYLGEDPYLASEIVVPIIRGVQSQEVIATVKHYIANNQEFDRHNVSSDVDERTLREIYMPAFRAAVQKGDVAAVMTSYNPVNGVHASEHNYLVNEVLKNEWGFEGLVMSDWVSTYSTEGVFNGGLDLEMPSGKYMNADSVKPLLESGVVMESTIDDKVRRIVKTILKFNFTEREQELADIPEDDPASRKAALQAAREGIVLLKNKNSLLPFDRENAKKIAVIGPSSHPSVHGGGGSSYTTPAHPVSIYDGIKKLAGDMVEIIHSRGIRDLSGKDTYGNSKFFNREGNNSLTAEYFDNMEMKGKPALVRNEESLNIVFNDNPAGGEHNANYSAKYTGFVKPEESGLYRFYVTGDDGYRLMIEGDTLVSAWMDQAPTARSATMNMEAGKSYGLILEYYQNGGGAEIRLGYEKEKAPEIDKAVKLAADADAVVLCVGFTDVTEGEGRDREYDLPEDQQELIEKTLEANPNTVIVLTAGGNVAMENWINNTNGLLHAWYPGQEGGTAIAEILFGDVNPSGKLPASFEKTLESSPVYNSYHDEDGDKRVTYTEGIFIGYRHFDKAENEPRFPFGYGLSYTTFEYEGLSIDKVDEANSKVKLSFNVKNSGDRAGAEVAQAYVYDKESTVKRPVKELKGFEKVYLEPGQSKKVEIILDKNAFQYYDVNKKSWVMEKGDFEIGVGSSSEDIRLTETVAL